MTVGLFAAGLASLRGAIGASTRGMNIRGGNQYTPGSPEYNAQEAFAAMTAKAEKNIIRDPVNKGVLGYTEAAGVTPLPGQTINIYDPSGTNIIRTQTGQALPKPGGGQGYGGIAGGIARGLTGQSYGNMPQQFDFSGFQNQMAQSQSQMQDQMARMQSQYQNQMQRLQYQNQPSQVASVQTPSSQQRRMGSIGSSFGRSGMQIKSVNV